MTDLVLKKKDVILKHTPPWFKKKKKCCKALFWVLETQVLGIETLISVSLEQM